MALLNAVSFCALLLSILGNLLVNCKRKSGFVVWIASNAFWVAVNFIGPTNWSQVVLFAIYTLLNAHGYIKWSKRQ